MKTFFPDSSILGVKGLTEKILENVQTVINTSTILEYSGRPQLEIYR